LLYSLDGVARADSNTLWMRRTVIRPAPETPADGRFEVRLREPRLLLGAQGGWRSAEIVTDHAGLRLSCSVAHLLPGRTPDERHHRSRPLRSHVGDPAPAAPHPAPAAHGPSREARDMPMTAILTGLGAYLPPRRVSNEELADRFDTTDEWITSRTGIRSRRWADPGTSTGDLAVEAGHRALKSAGVDPGPGAVDLVVLATTTPDHLCPATAPDVAARLGLTGAAAYDISAVCSGFVYALETAANAIGAGRAAPALVIGAETYSTILNPADRTTSVIFGDGAGAVVLTAGDADRPGALHGFELGSDGTQKDVICIPAGGSRQRAALTEPAPGDEYFAM